MGTKNNPGKFDCYDAAKPDEPMFVLLARDRHAPQLVREWANLREAELADSMLSVTAEERAHKVAKIAEARACAQAMDEWHEDWIAAAFV